MWLENKEPIENKSIDSEKIDISKLISEWKKFSSEILDDYWIDKISTEKWILLVSSKNWEIVSPEWIFFESINSFTDTPTLISQQKDGNFVLLSAITWKSILWEDEYYKEISYSFGGILCESDNWNIKLLDDFWEELFSYKTNENTILLDQNYNFKKTWLFHILEWDSILLDKKWKIIDGSERKVIKNNGNYIELWMHIFDEETNSFYRFKEIKKYFWLVKNIEKHYISNQK